MNPVTARPCRPVTGVGKAPRPTGGRPCRPTIKLRQFLHVLPFACWQGADPGVFLAAAPCPGPAWRCRSVSVSGHCGWISTSRSGSAFISHAAGGLHAGPDLGRTLARVASRFSAGVANRAHGRRGGQVGRQGAGRLRVTRPSRWVAGDAANAVPAGRDASGQRRLARAARKSVPRRDPRTALRRCLPTTLRRSCVGGSSLGSSAMGQRACDCRPCFQKIVRPRSWSRN